MKKRIIAIILSIIVVLGIITIIFIKPIKYKLKVSSYEKRLLSFYNLNKDDRDDYGNYKIDDYLALSNTEYDITRFINFYLKQITNTSDEKIEHIHERLIGIIIDGMDLSDFVDKENVNLDEVVKELEKIFIHKSDDIYKEWYMPVEIPSNIETKETDYGLEVDMPLGYYYIYEKSDYKKLDDIKRVKDFKFIEDIDFEKSMFYKYRMTIELIDGTEKVVEDKIEYDKRKNDFYPYFYDIYYVGDPIATITLKNRDMDKAVAEYWSHPDAF